MNELSQPKCEAISSEFVRIRGGVIFTGGGACRKRLGAMPYLEARGPLSFDGCRGCTLGRQVKRDSGFGVGGGYAIGRVPVPVWLY